MPKPAEDDVEVYADHWDAVMLFLRVQTQWRLAGMGGRIGLDYTAVHAAMEMMATDRARRPDIFAQLQVIEEGVLQVDGERAEADEAKRKQQQASRHGRR